MGEREDEPELTNSFLDRCGRRIRDCRRQRVEVSADDLRVVDRYRAVHVPIVDAVQTRIVQYLHERSGLPEERYPVTSRLKTPPAIVAKLQRSTTALSRMGDIAGARIVVPDLDLQEAVTAYLDAAFDDYSPTTKSTLEEADQYGYRAIHLMLRRDGRFAEIQIRTVWQDRWAQVVERLDSGRGWDLKHGWGPTEWLEWLHALSDAFRRADLGQPSQIPTTPDDRLIEGYEDEAADDL